MVPGLSTTGRPGAIATTPSVHRHQLCIVVSDINDHHHTNNSDHLQQPILDAFRCSTKSTSPSTVATVHIVFRKHLTPNIIEQPLDDIGKLMYTTVMIILEDIHLEEFVCGVHVDVTSGY